MHKFLFTGPTLSWLDVKSLNIVSNVINLSCIQDLDKQHPVSPGTIFVLPPVAGGDLWKIREYPSQFLIAIIDGYFENRISVWHREIIHFLSKGIPVLGASSMGALRASELNRYGMIGIGEIYKNFSEGIWEDDDEVTVCHGPSELGYPQISEAMANIRYTLSAAVRDNVLSQTVQAQMLNIAKSTFYKNRNYGAIIRSCIEHNGMNEKDFSRFLLWLQKYRVDQKKIDAQSLVRFIDNDKNIESISRSQEFIFEDTVLWRNCIGA